MILVVLENQRGKIHPFSIEALVAGQKFAKNLNCDLAVLCIGEKVAELKNEPKNDEKQEEITQSKDNSVSQEMLGSLLFMGLKALGDADKICEPGNKQLRESIEAFMVENGEDDFAISCSKLDPMQIVLDEKKRELNTLQAMKISPKEWSSLISEEDTLKDEVSALEKKLGETSVGKVSPKVIDDVRKSITGLTSVIRDLESAITLKVQKLEELKKYSEQNSGNIEELANLNTGLADTLAVKQKISNELEDARSELRNVDSSILILQSDIALINERITTVQNEMEASSDVNMDLIEEVKDLEQSVDLVQSEVSSLETERDFLESELNTLSEDLASKRVRNDQLDQSVADLTDQATVSEAKANMLSPQVEALETTVESQQRYLEEDYVPISVFNELLNEMSELTVAVTEKQRLKEELEMDLNEVRNLEDRYLTTCFEDRDCKAAMADLLGFD